MCPWVTVAIPDRESWWEKILPDMFGIWSECSSSHHEGYHQHSAGSARNCGPHYICIHRWHLYQWGYSVHDLQQRTSSSVWAGMQRPRTVERWCMSAGTGDRDSTRWMNRGEEAWFPTPPLSSHDSIRYVWEACWAPPGVCLAPFGLRNTQEESKCGHEGPRQWNEGHPPPAHGVWDHGPCTTGWSSSWKLVQGWPVECVGRCQFSGNQSGSGETWNNAGECLLAATRERHPTYQTPWAGHHIERRQFSSPVAEQGATCEDRFCVHVPLGIQHPDGETTSEYQGSEMLIRRWLNILKDL